MSFKSLIATITPDNLGEYLDDILDYYDYFKIFTTPFETLYSIPPSIEQVDRIYEASIDDEDGEDQDDQTVMGDSLYNISFRFKGTNGIFYYAYAHMRINYELDVDNEFIRGTLFLSKNVELFFMTTLASINENDDLHSFLLDDGVSIAFDKAHLPLAVHMSLENYIFQISNP